MSADLAVVGSDICCSRCGLTADLCMASRDDCCVDCTHFPVSDDADVDPVAVMRAVEGDVSVALTRAEHKAAWRELESRRMSAAVIGDLLGTTDRTVQRWRDGHAHPTARPSGGRMTTTPIAAAQSATESLLQRGRRSESPKVKTAVRRADEAMDRLREALADDDGKREARERVARLEQELRAAKAALRGKPVSAAATHTRATGTPAECRKCGKPCANNAGRAAHERNCAAA